MKFNKQSRIVLGILSGITTLTMCVLLFMGAFFVNDRIEPYLKRPGLYELNKRINSEKNEKRQVQLGYEYRKLKERKLSIIEKAFLGLLQGLVFLLSILVIPLGGALVFKIVPSRELLSRGIVSRGKFWMDKTNLLKAENPGIYKFHRVDDKFFVFSKPKMRRKLIRAFIIWVIITTVVFIALYNPDTVEILGLPVACLLITLIIFLRMVLPAPKLIFDRMLGEVKFKSSIVNPGFNASFDKITPALIYGELLAVSHPIFEYSILAYGAFNQDTWSFYVQYMDRNRPLPQGNMFDEFREKDYNRRKKEGFKAPKYFSSMYICDANSGYINGTDEFKKEIKSYKLNIEDAHEKVQKFIEKREYILADPYKLCFIGIYNDQMVFKYMENPVYEDLQVFKNDKELNDCYFIHKKNYKITAL